MYSGTQTSLDSWIGPGRALDPDHWFVVCPGQLGNGSSTSPSTTRGPFPDLTIGDDVTTQHRLVTDELGIERVALALGFSMGAQQAYEWAVRFPGVVERLAVFAGLARTTPGTSRLVAASEEALRTGGTGQHARFWAATGLSAELYRREAWCDAGYVSVDDMVRRLFEDDYAARDPADLLCQLGKWRRADVSRQTGASLPEALGRITARTVVAPFSHDAWFPVADCEEEQRLIGGSRLRVVESVWGHYAWGIAPSETAQIERVVVDLLAT
jgi:homoserine O-acetyltransferase